MIHLKYEVEVCFFPVFMVDEPYYGDKLKCEV